MSSREDPTSGGPTERLQTSLSSTNRLRHCSDSLALCIKLNQLRLCSCRFVVFESLVIWLCSFALPNLSPCSTNLLCSNAVPSRFPDLSVPLIAVGSAQSPCQIYSALNCQPGKINTSQTTKPVNSNPNFVKKFVDSNSVLYQEFWKSNEFYSEGRLQPDKIQEKQRTNPNWQQTTVSFESSDVRKPDSVDRRSNRRITPWLFKKPNQIQIR